MKLFRTVALLTLLSAVPALAQWQTPNHSIPIGRGAGVQGFGSVVPSIAGRPFIDNGTGVDPGFGTIANSGFTSGAANTVKGSLNGSSVTDIPFPNCTSNTQAIQWLAGTGPQCGNIFNTTGYDMPINMGMSSSAVAGALTINLTTASGGTPSSGSPVLVPFRSTTATAGTINWSTITSATSITIPSGATLGTSNTVPFRVWVFLNYNNGVPSLGVATCSNSTTIFPCASWEGTLKTTVAISAGATAGGTLYAPVGVSLDAVRIVGYCDYSTGLATAGTWSAACSIMQLVGPGIKKPGESVQTVYATTGASVTTLNTYANSATPPAIAGGAVAIAAPAITPTSAINHLVIDARTTITSAAASDHNCYLYNGASVLSVAMGAGGNASNVGGLCVIGVELSNVSASTTYSLYFTGATATGINGTSGGTQWWGGAGNTSIRIVEVQG